MRLALALARIAKAARAAIVIASSCVVVACGDSDDSAGDTGPGVTLPGTNPCGEGFEPLTEGAGCTPIVAAACGAGERASIGAKTCKPTGNTACAPGFVRDPSGWGCDVVIAPAACTGATRERLGNSGCSPISDCSAAFPPAGASIFVNAAYLDAQLDAAHFKTIADAVAAAPAGAIIAVDSGTYVEKVKLKRRKVAIVGRCTEKVVWQQLPDVIGSGLEADTNDEFLLEKVTMRGFNAAVAVLGGSATLRAVLIEDGLFMGVVGGNIGTEVKLENVVVRHMQARAGSDQAFGAFVSAGARMTIEDSVFAGNEYFNLGTTKDGSTLKVSRSIMRDGKPGSKGTFGIGVYVAEGASATIEESALVDNTSAGLAVYTAGAAANTLLSSATLRGSVVRGTKLDRAGAGRGVDVSRSRVVIERSTIAGSGQNEIVVASKAEVKVDETTLRGNAPASDGDRGALGLTVDSATTKARSLAIVRARAGVELQGTGALEMNESIIASTRNVEVFYEKDHWIGLGMLVESKASLRLRDSALQDVRTAGMLVSGSAELAQVLVRGTRPARDGFAGRGLSVQVGGSASVASSAFLDNTESGVMVTVDGATLTMTGSTIADTGLDGQGQYGMGLLVGSAASANVEKSTITGSKGIGIAVAAAGALIRSTTISRNVIGVHSQEGTSLAEGETADPLKLMVSSDTRFIANGSRVGNGIVPLPRVLETLTAGGTASP